ncbi:Hypothetical predicted protein [Pelobates cultripes]|uniref:Uncharacterized protein n=1 Tax=Pelobates cultripes TaxID=61616 RepID=A0AAD1W0L7_PELCU|nr:Hypothetical predicted protein [Pelobates cultripes]
MHKRIQLTIKTASNIPEFLKKFRIPHTDILDWYTIIPMGTAAALPQRQQGKPTPDKKCTTNKELSQLPHLSATQEPVP